MRCFLALPLAGPAAMKLRKALAAWHSSEPQIGWEAPEALHLTLQFIGAWQEERTGEIVAALAGWPWQPFSLTLEGVGGFPDLWRPRVVWAGVQPAVALEALVAGIAERLAPLGIRREARAFTPHLSLARLRPGQRLSAAWTHQMRASPPVWGACPAANFCLCESLAGIPGAGRYAVRREFPAGGGVL